MAIERPLRGNAEGSLGAATVDRSCNPTFGYQSIVACHGKNLRAASAAFLPVQTGSKRLLRAFSCGAIQLWNVKGRTRPKPAIRRIVRSRLLLQHHVCRRRRICSNTALGDRGCTIAAGFGGKRSSSATIRSKLTTTRKNASNESHCPCSNRLKVRSGMPHRSANSFWLNFNNLRSIRTRSAIRLRNSAAELLTSS